MTTHVFIVDFITFKYHLEYMFAGTGAKDSVVDFNNSANTSLKAPTENTLVNMIADVSRIRQDDYVIFYLQQNKDEGIMEGKFYGIFKIMSEPFLDNLKHSLVSLNLANNYYFKYPKNNFKFKIDKKEVLLKTALTAYEKQKILDRFPRSSDKIKVKDFITRFYRNNQYVLKKLEKSLTFRVKIKPYQVYPEGVTEWKALDDIQKIVSPKQMLWSLIYRKLKGGRGCTPITLYESKSLWDLIRKNNKEPLKLRGYPDSCRLTFEKDTERIEKKNIPLPGYSGRSQRLNVLPRLIQKDDNGDVYESHLQAYIVSILGKGINNILDEILLENNKNLVWLGNEVACGVGMRKMDILYTMTQDDQYFHYPVELKSDYPSTDNVWQLQRYIDWLRQYYITNIPGNIIPILITYKIPNNKISRSKVYKYESDGNMSAFYSSIINLFNDFNRKNNMRIKYVEYDVSKGGISFNEVGY